MMANKKLNLKLEDRDTLPLKVANVIRKAILQGEIEPGERLIQEDLANVLGVSRMPVREALRKLEIEGLIELVPHKGAIVKPLNMGDVEEIYQLRATLESMAVKRSVGEMTEDEIKKLEFLSSAMKATDDPEEFVETNIEFHRLLMKHCKWDRLLSFIETLWNGFPQQTPHMLPNQVYLSNKEHDEILNAVKEKQSEKAGDLLYGHIFRTGQSLLESIRESKKEDSGLIQKLKE